MTRQDAVSKSLTALLKGEVAKAVELSSRQCGGAGALYEHETGEIVRCILDQDYTPDPGLKPKVIEPFRVVAAAMELWGEGDLQEFAEVSGPWRSSYEPAAVIRLLHAAGLQAHRLRYLGAMGTKKVRVHSPLEPCPEACRKDLGKTYPVESAPILPHHDAECRCSFFATREAAPIPISAPDSAC